MKCEKCGTRISGRESRCHYCGAAVSYAQSSADIGLLIRSFFLWFMRFRDKGALKGEKCTLCKTRMNTGATVCTGCQATRKLEPGGFIGTLAFILYLIAFVCGVFGLIALSTVGSDKLLVPLLVKGKQLSIVFTLIIYIVFTLSSWTLFVFLIFKMPLRVYYHKK